MALLLAIAIPSYRAILDGQKGKSAIADMRSIGLQAEKYAMGHDAQYPASLNDMGIGAMVDPWGNPYQYLNLQDPASGARARKDHNLHPINTHFDLYSMGPDGDSNAPLTAQASRDDIIWANDGAFVGIAADY
jgi:general secretion pathway protein G